MIRFPISATPDIKLHATIEYMAALASAVYAAPYQHGADLHTTIEWLYYLESSQAEMQRIRDLVNHNQDFFRAQPGDDSLQAARLTLERLLDQFQKGPRG